MGEWEGETSNHASLSSSMEGATAGCAPFHRSAIWLMIARACISVVSVKSNKGSAASLPGDNQDAAGKDPPSRTHS